MREEYRLHRLFDARVGGDQVTAQLRSLIAAFISLLATFRFNSQNGRKLIERYLAAVCSGFDPENYAHTDTQQQTLRDLAAAAEECGEGVARLCGMAVSAVHKTPKRVTVTGVSVMGNPPESMPPALDVPFPMDLGDRLALMEALADGIGERMGIYDHGISAPFDLTPKVLRSLVGYIRSRLGSCGTPDETLKRCLDHLAEAKRSAEFAVR